MSETNKSYRIRANVGLGEEYITLNANLLQDYDSFDIMSIKIRSTDVYRLHNSNYGVVVGRVIANNGFGVPNAKISVFIPINEDENADIASIYPFINSMDKNDDGVRYNLLPDEKVGDCHQVVGTFPNKRYLLDNDILIEVFDKYYKYTTRTNNAGDYILIGIPKGNQTLHMDLDLSDCGILSQRPRDFVYKGYTIEQFENPNMFKDGAEYSTLSQVFSQDQNIGVKPFWGNSDSGEEIGITRADINISFKFEPTCVFIGSVASDNSSQGIAKGCVPTPHMGDMDELTTGEGRIEMIRKTPGGSVEEFQIRGTQLINADGVWCYQIPMNLDYMMTDEYGNMVPTDNPEKGVPTRARVRFRLSMQDNEQNTDNYFRPKVLIPNNPQNLPKGLHEDYDYEFGTNTSDESFRDLFWNNVYSVKSYIPRFQKRGSSRGWKEDRYTGIKGCNFFGANNPLPYNNIRIKMPFMFKMMCLITKVLVVAISILNTITYYSGWILARISEIVSSKHGFMKAMGLKLTTIADGLCPDLENWYFAPIYVSKIRTRKYNSLVYNILYQTLKSITTDNEVIGGDAGEDEALIEYNAIKVSDDPNSIDKQNADEEDETTCITVKTDYLMSCIEMNLAMEYKVIKFNFYNDWVNGFVYIPRFMRYIRPKKRFLGITVARSKVRGCMDDVKVFAKTRKYTQQCAIGYTRDSLGLYTNVEKDSGNKYHKRSGFLQATIFGKKGGICHEHPTKKGQHVYYLKPCEWPDDSTKVNLFATDIILLGSLNSCDQNGLPQAFRYLSSSSYIMPTNLALTNMETNGPLYAFKDAKGNKTMCMSVSNGNTITYPAIQYGAKEYSKEQIESFFPAVQDLMSGITSNSTSALTQELLYLSSSTSPNDTVVFDNEELADYIPMTIAAGISWNYTGPGQGKINKDEIYYPGGHFLGMSCKNSQTNIKSCINLERICEVGSTMSQRKEEDVIKMDANGNLEYAYSSPTGFISGEEIINTDFRTMFATMNGGRLIANKTNPLTGYKIYDFDYYRPSNFDGAFANVVNTSTNYNAKRYVADESGMLHNLFGIALGTGRSDYDRNEVLKSQNRTRENASMDYYMFRFGFNNSNMGGGEQERKFLKKNKNTGKLFLPQYENSFYFYFGMHEGATAIDEFNKQFFSECEKTSLIGDEVGLDLTQKVEICKGTGTIHVKTTNLQTPFEKIVLTYTEDGQIIEDTGYTPTFKNSVEFEISGLSLTDYNVYIKDANEIELNKNITIGGDLVTSEILDFDFNTELYAGIVPGIYRGGYVEVSDIGLKNFDGTMSSVAVILNDANGQFVSSAVTSLGANIVRLYANNEGAYKLQLRYKCDGEGMDFVTLPMGDVSLAGPSSLDVRIGNSQLFGLNESIKDKIGYSGTTEWFETIGNAPSDTKNWLYKICFFDEINSSREGIDTFSNMVYGVNGNKLLWGNPQNSSGINTSVVSCSENGDVPVGYTLDDDASYYPTYGATGDVKNYSAVVSNGPLICGRCYGYITNGSTHISADDKKHYKKGSGYIFRPVLPEGPTEYYVYDGVNLNHSDASEGLFFPTVSYPVMKRPFYADMNFFIRHNIEVRVDGSTYIEVEQVKGTHTEGVIHNGITFDNKFSSASSVNGQSINIEVSQPDTYGLTKEDSDDRLTTLFLRDTGDSGVTGGYYSITEGSPDSTHSLLAHTISDGASPVMYENFSYEQEGGYLRVFVYGDTGTDANAKYYICSQDDDIQFIENSKTCIGYRREYKVEGTVFTDYYIYCRDNGGNPLAARIYTEDLNHQTWYCEYNGNVTILTGVSETMLDDMFYDDYVTILAQVDLNPQRERNIKPQPTLNGDDISWAEAVATTIKEEMHFTNRRYDSTNTYNPDDMFIVGIYEQNPLDNPDGTTRVYKIYPYIIRGRQM